MTSVKSEVDGEQIRIARQLVQAHGYFIGGEVLWRLLAYKSASTFRQAKRRNCVPVPLIKLPHRHGAFALSEDVARWIASTSRKRNHQPANAEKEGESHDLEE